MPPPPDAPAAKDTGAPAPPPAPAVPARLSRRRFLLRNLALLGTLTFSEGIHETNWIQVSTHTAPIPGLRAPLRVVQLSDLHRSEWVSEGFIARVVAQANALRP